MSRRFVTHPETTTNRIVICTGCVAVSFLTVFFFSFHKGQAARKSIFPAGASSAIVAQTKPKLTVSYGKLALSFELNQGQTDPHVKFVSHGRGYTLLLATDETVLALKTPSGATRSSGTTSPSWTTTTACHLAAKP